LPAHLAPSCVVPPLPERAASCFLPPTSYFSAFPVWSDDKRRPHLLAPGMQRGVLDAELPHRNRASFLPVKLLGQGEMLCECVSLLANRRRRRQGTVFPKGAGSFKDPRVADGPAGDRHPVHPGLADHPHAVLGGKEVAAAENRAVADMPLHFRQKRPATRADVALFDGAAVDGDGRHPRRKAAVENLEELVAGPLCVVDASPHLHGDGNLGRNGVARAVNDFQRYRGL